MGLDGFQGIDYGIEIYKRNTIMSLFQYPIVLSKYKSEMLLLAAQIEFILEYTRENV